MLSNSDATAPSRYAKSDAPDTIASESSKPKPPGRPSLSEIMAAHQALPTKKPGNTDDAREAHADIDHPTYWANAANRYRYLRRHPSIAKYCALVLPLGPEASDDISVHAVTVRELFETLAEVEGLSAEQVPGWPAFTNNEARIAMAKTHLNEKDLHLAAASYIPPLCKALSLALELVASDSSLNASDLPLKRTPLGALAKIATPLMTLMTDLTSDAEQVSTTAFEKGEAARPQGITETHIAESAEEHGVDPSKLNEAYYRKVLARKIQALLLPPISSEAEAEAETATAGCGTTATAQTHKGPSPFPASLLLSTKENLRKTSHGATASASTVENEATLLSPLS